MIGNDFMKGNLSLIRSSIKNYRFKVAVKVEDRKWYFSILGRKKIFVQKRVKNILGVTTVAVKIIIRYQKFT